MTIKWTGEDPKILFADERYAIMRNGSAWIYLYEHALDPAGRPYWKSIGQTKQAGFDDSGVVEVILHLIHLLDTERSKI